MNFIINSIIQNITFKIKLCTISFSVSNMAGVVNTKNPLDWLFGSEIESDCSDTSF